MKAIAQRVWELPHELARTSRSNFYYSFLLLPKAKRQGIKSVYKFCRAVDDLVDEQEDPHEAGRGLDWWRSEIGRVYANKPSIPLSQELMSVVQTFTIPQEYFHEVIKGVEMDLTHRRYEAFEDLYAYCYRVASVVGLICIEIFGYRDPATKTYAVDLGVALQLTNILRDIKEDAGRDRIYLPAEDLHRFQYPETDLQRCVYNARFVTLMEFECARAREWFARAEATLPRTDARSLLAAQAMGAIYNCLLKEIVRSRYDVFTHRIEVSRRRRLAVALLIGLRSMYG